MAAIVTIRLLTSLLSPQEVGRNYILLSLGLWFSWVLINPVAMYMNRKLIEWDSEGKARQHFLSFIRYSLLVSGVAFVILLAIQRSVGIGINIKTTWILWIILGSLLFGTLRAWVTNALNLLGHRFEFVLFTNLVLWISLGISVLLSLGISAKAEYWITGQLIGQTMILILAGIIFWKTLHRPNPSMQLEGKIDKSFSVPVVFRFSWPLTIIVGLYWLQSQSYRFILGSLSGMEIVGLFAAGYAVSAGLMAVFEQLFSQFYHPIFFNAVAGKDSEGRADVWNEYASCFIPAIILMGAFVALSGPFLAKVMLGERFQQEAGVIIFWGAFAEVCRLVGSAYYMAALAELDMRPLIIPCIVSALIAPVGVFSLALWNPFIGTGLSLFLATFANALYFGRKLQKQLPITFPWRRIAVSGILSLPIVVIFLGLKLFLFNPTILQSFTTLTVVGGYMLFAQFIMAKPWILIGSKSSLSSIHSKSQML